MAETPAMFTPGPWRFDVEAGTVGQSKIGGIEVVAVMEQPPLGVNRWDADAMLANGRLVAAAPELLAACKAIVVRLPPAFADNIAQLNAAISKAEGRNV